MIRKLRTRLVLASMLSLIAVLGVIMGGLNLMNYQRIVRDSDGVLALLGKPGSMLVYLLEIPVMLFGLMRQFTFRLGPEQRGMVMGGGRALYTLTPRSIAALALGCLLASSLPHLALGAIKPGARQWLSLVAVPALLALCLMALASGAYNPFIYFQF